MNAVKNMSRKCQQFATYVMTHVFSLFVSIIANKPNMRIKTASLALAIGAASNLAGSSNSTRCRIFLTALASYSVRIALWVVRKEKGRYHGSCEMQLKWGDGG